MVALEAVRQANRGLTKAFPKKLTALFVGGTSGIGRSTLCQFTRHVEEPTVYIVGRNKQSAAPLLSELQTTNPRGSIHFLEADVSLMRNVDRVCEEVKQREKSLNLLFMTPGGISLTGRSETTEGIDKIFALRYYARMRFVQNLLHLLENTTPSRVVSILGGGFEGPMKTDDLDLKNNFSVLNCALHSVTMTTLAMEHLSQTTSSPDLSFIHAFPGIVGTNIYTNSFPAPIAALYNYGMWPLMWPFSVNLQESGERHLFQSTSARYPGKGMTEPSALPTRVSVAVGSDGHTGSGVYLTNWKGETSVGGRTLQRYREDGLPAEVWSHTTELLQRAAARTDV
ncbi:hypothetical protein AMS68_000126 [Peltaster fructicola]|uniref:Ketoreductase (KR) domain-containing protein n=1 Tax=Peltaster fructicola TaxID=286661 RepID=A0A6H0XIZ7_9PEZI|nr:hypothetical protein AMS68_000126 [Peltaster fructicola]